MDNANTSAAVSSKFSPACYLWVIDLTSDITVTIVCHPFSDFTGPPSELNTICMYISLRSSLLDMLSRFGRAHVTFLAHAKS